MISIQYDCTASQKITVSIVCNINDIRSTLKFARWRPGRYEIQNCERALVSMSITCNGNEVAYIISDTSEYEIKTKGLNSNDKICITCVFRACVLDAGNNCYVQNGVISILPLLITPYFTQNDIVNIHILFPKGHDLKTTLPHQVEHIDGDISMLSAKHIDIDTLFDSPIVGADDTLEQYDLVIPNSENLPIRFHLITEETYQDLDFFIKPLSHCVNKVLSLHSARPFKEYIFHIIIYPSAKGHGVEHQQSTVITLAAKTDYNIYTNHKLHDTLLDICTHEFLHVWNIKHIRPRELVSYSYQKKQQFETCLLVEGVTSYLGSILPYECGVYKTEYLFEKGGRFSASYNLFKHFESQFTVWKSCIDASLALWVDGYSNEYSTSSQFIYAKGKLIMLSLDAQLYVRFGTRLVHVMEKMFSSSGIIEKGYVWDDFLSALTLVCGDREFASHWFRTVVNNTQTPIDLLLNIQDIGIVCQKLAVETIKNEDQKKDTQNQYILSISSQSKLDSFLTSLF